MNGSGSGGASFSGRPRIGDWGQWLTIGEPNGTNNGTIIQIDGSSQTIGFGSSPSLTGSPTIHTKINTNNGYLSLYQGQGSAGWGLGQILYYGTFRGSGTYGTNYQFFTYTVPASGTYVVGAYIEPNKGYDSGNLRIGWTDAQDGTGQYTGVNISNSGSGNTWTFNAQGAINLYNSISGNQPSFTGSLSFFVMRVG